MSATMLALLKQRAPVAVFDRARRTDGLIRELFNQILQIGRFIGASLSQRQLSLYVALSGGKSQIFDGLYLLISKLLGRRAYIHHHSFAYVDRSSVINRALFTLLRNQTHLVLSGQMGSALAQRYSLDEGKVIVMSNAAFFTEAPTDSRLFPTKKPDSPIRLGFFSNITFEKGFVEFFDVLQRLRELHVEYRAYLAGPVAPDARETFDRLCSSTLNVEYVGAIYDDAKDRFFQQLDILLFPTKYANEAEPLVIHEALRGGVYVIACRRGAIADTLSNGAGRVFLLENFVDSAVQSIRALCSDRAQLIQGQRLAFEQAQRLYATGSKVLSKVLAEIAE